MTFGHLLFTDFLLQNYKEITLTSESTFCVCATSDVNTMVASEAIRSYFHDKETPTSMLLTLI